MNTSTNNDYLKYLNDKLYFRQRQLNHSSLFIYSNNNQSIDNSNNNDIFEDQPKLIYQTILPISIITPISLDRFNYLEYLKNNPNCYSNNIYDDLTSYYDSQLHNQQNKNEEKLSLAQAQSNKNIRKRYSMNEQSLSLSSQTKTSSIKYRFSLKAISNKITSSVENLRNKFNTSTQSTKSFNKLSLPNDNLNNLSINDDNSSFLLMRSAQNMYRQGQNIETDYEDDFDDEVFYDKHVSKIMNENELSNLNDLNGYLNNINFNLLKSSDILYSSSTSEDDKNTRESQHYSSDDEQICRDNETNKSSKYSNWSYLPYVKKSGYLNKMSKKDIELQERWFEIFSSEHYYLENLNILNNVIKKKCSEILEIYDLKLLFTQYIDDFLDISKRLTQLLEDRLKSDIKIDSFFDILEDFMFSEKFEYCFVNYAGEQLSQKEHFDKFMKNNRKFNELISKLIADPVLKGKDISTYLISPTQRLSRYKLLIDAVNKTLPETEILKLKVGLNLSKKIDQLLIKANSKAAIYANYTETMKIKSIIKFHRKELETDCLITNERHLLYHSDLVCLNSLFLNKDKILNGSNKINSSIKNDSILNNKIYHLILFNDMLLICFKEIKGEKKNFTYKVFEKYENEQVSAELTEFKTPTLYQDENKDSDNGKANSDKSMSLVDPNNVNKVFLLSLNMNQKDNQVQKKSFDAKYLFLCSKLIGENWLKYLNLKQNNKQININYSENDLNFSLKKTNVLISYEPVKKNEMTVIKGELVLILKWNETTNMCYCERLRDLTRGWLPSKILSYQK